jgi:Xaa-Pro aminopeptidase
MGARLNGYCSDITRTVVVGRPDATLTRVYDTVLAAQLTAIATVQSGMTGHDADGLARKVIEQAGYGDNFGHSLGHGIGLAVHEHPRVGPNSSSSLDSSMVFTIEPGIYIPGWGGVRIEDMVVLQNGRARVLTEAPKALD